MSNQRIVSPTRGTDGANAGDSEGINMSEPTTETEVPKIRTVSTTRTTGTIAVRYVPRPICSTDTRTNKVTQ